MPSVSSLPFFPILHLPSLTLLMAAAGMFTPEIAAEQHQVWNPQQQQQQQPQIGQTPAAMGPSSAYPSYAPGRVNQPYSEQVLGQPKAEGLYAPGGGEYGLELGPGGVPATVITPDGNVIGDRNEYGTIPVPQQVPYPVVDHIPPTFQPTALIAVTADASKEVEGSRGGGGRRTGKKRVKCPTNPMLKSRRIGCRGKPNPAQPYEIEESKSGLSNVATVPRVYLTPVGQYQQPPPSQAPVLQQYAPTGSIYIPQAIPDQRLETTVSHLGRYRDEPMVIEEARDDDGDYEEEEDESDGAKQRRPYPPGLVVIGLYGGAGPPQQAPQQQFSPPAVPQGAHHVYHHHILHGDAGRAIGGPPAIQVPPQLDTTRFLNGGSQTSKSVATNGSSQQAPFYIQETIHARIEDTLNEPSKKLEGGGGAGLVPIVGAIPIQPLPLTSLPAVAPQSAVIGKEAEMVAIQQSASPPVAPAFNTSSTTTFFSSSASSGAAPPSATQQFSRQLGDSPPRSTQQQFQSSRSFNPNLANNTFADSTTNTYSSSGTAAHLGGIERNVEKAIATEFGLYHPVAKEAISSPPSLDLQQKEQRLQINQQQQEPVALPSANMEQQNGVNSIPPPPPQQVGKPDVALGDIGQGVQASQKQSHNKAEVLHERSLPQSNGSLASSTNKAPNPGPLLQRQPQQQMQQQIPEVPATITAAAANPQEEQPRPQRQAQLQQQQQCDTTCGGDPNWRYYNCNCYYLSVRRQGMTQAQAQADCRSAGGPTANLASIHSAGENAFVAALSKGIAPLIIDDRTKGDPTLAEGGWLGLSRNSRPGGLGSWTCQWNDGSSVDYGGSDCMQSNGASQRPWGDDQPDNRLGGEGCVFMVSYGTPSDAYAEWGDYPCTRRFMGAYCKKPALGSGGGGSAMVVLPILPTQPSQPSQPLPAPAAPPHTTVVGPTPPRSLPVQPPEERCGWYYRNGYCYRLNVKESGVNYNQARAECQSLNAELPSVHSFDENAFIASISAKFAQAVLLCPYPFCSDVAEQLPQNFIAQGYWLGMTRKKDRASGRFTCAWSDNTPIDYPGNECPPGFSITYPWSPYSPDLFEEKQQCIHQFPFYSSYYSLWNDWECSFKMKGVMCKKPCTDPCQQAGEPIPIPTVVVN